MVFNYNGMMNAIVSRSWDNSTYYVDGKYMYVDVEIECTQDKLKSKGTYKYQIAIDMTRVQPNLNETRNAQGTWSRDVNFDIIPDNANWFSPNYHFHNFYRAENKIPTPYKEFTVKRLQRNIKFKNVKVNAIHKLVAVSELRDNVAATYGGNSTLPMVNFYDTKPATDISYFTKEPNPDSVITAPKPNVKFSGTYTNVSNNNMYEHYYKGCSDVYARLNITLQNKHRYGMYITETTFATPIMVDSRSSSKDPSKKGVMRVEDRASNNTRWVRRAELSNSIFTTMYHELFSKRMYTGNSFVDNNTLYPFWLYGRTDLVDARRFMSVVLMYALYSGSFKGFTEDDFANFFKYLYSASDVRNGFADNDLARTRYANITSWIGTVSDNLTYSHPIITSQDVFMKEYYPNEVEYRKYLYEHLFDFNTEEKAENTGKRIYNTYMKTVNNKDAGPALEAAKALVNEYKSGPSNRSARYDNTPDDGVDIVEEWMDDINNDDRIHNDPYATKTIALQPDIFNQQDPTSSRLTVLAKTRIGNTMHILVEAVSLHYIYRCIDYVQPSLVTIIQPAKNFLDNYKTVISIELPKDSTGYIGTWQDGYDLSYPTTITINDMDTISNNEFLEMANRDDVVPNVIIGFYKPGVDPDFTTYVKKSKKSGLYLKVDTTLTENKAGDRSSKSEEFYYPLFNTIGRNVERKLDLLYNNKVYFARTSGAREIILQNGASFFPNPLLDYVLSILDNSSDSKILRLY